mmetsp:Transcript_13721/g.42490  ORF Transcript_13721/g.42490 Transcript_13721/m.42490 type:complete len:415 (+) Transcript_13721:976-2220(+)
MGLCTVRSFVPSGNVPSTWTSPTVSGTPGSVWRRPRSFWPVDMSSATPTPSRIFSSMTVAMRATCARGSVPVPSAGRGSRAAAASVRSDDARADPGRDQTRHVPSPRTGTAASPLTPFAPRPAAAPRGVDRNRRRTRDAFQPASVAATARHPAQRNRVTTGQTFRRPAPRARGLGLVQFQAAREAPLRERAHLVELQMIDLARRQVHVAGCAAGERPAAAGNEEKRHLAAIEFATASQPLQLTTPRAPRPRSRPLRRQRGRLNLRKTLRSARALSAQRNSASQRAREQCSLQVSRRRLTATRWRRLRSQLPPLATQPAAARSPRTASHGPRRRDRRGRGLRGRRLGHARVPARRHGPDAAAVRDGAAVRRRDGARSAKRQGRPRVLARRDAARRARPAPERAAHGRLRLGRAHG